MKQSFVEMKVAIWSPRVWILALKRHVGSHCAAKGANRKSFVSFVWSFCSLANTPCVSLLKILLTACASVRVVDAKNLITPFVTTKLEIQLGTKCSQFELFMKFTVTGIVFVGLFFLIKQVFEFSSIF